MAALLNLLPIPIGLGWVYLHEETQVIISILVRVVGAGFMLVLATAGGIAGCLGSTEPDCGESAELLLITGVVAILVISALHAFLVSSRRNSRSC